MTRRTVPGLLLAATLACGTPSPEEVETTTVVPVRTARATTGDIRGVVRATGVVEPGPGASLTVTAPFPARIAEIPHAEGEAVRPGDLLVRFDIPSLAADAASRRADLDRAEARLTLATAAQARARDLFERGVAARREVEDADRERADAETALREARAGRSAAADLAGRTTVRATFAGIVARRFHDPGDLVEPSASDPVLRVIDPRRLEVEAAITVADVPRIAVGAPARVRVAGTGRSEPAAVASRPAAVDADTGTVPVRVRFLDTPRLAAGTPVLVEIEAELHAGVVIVPLAAIVREGEEAAVFVVADGHARRTPVALGLVSGNLAEVTSGLAAGAEVVVDGQAALPDGAAIAPRQADP